MALPKKKIRKAGPAPFVRTAGFPGDPDMVMLEKYAQDGAGVDETVENVGSNPNAKFLRDIGPEIV